MRAKKMNNLSSNPIFSTEMTPLIFSYYFQNLSIKRRKFCIATDVTPYLADLPWTLYYDVQPVTRRLIPALTATTRCD